MQGKVLKVIAHPPATAPATLKRVALDATVHGYWMPEQSVHIKVLIVAELHTTDGRDLCEIRPIFANGELGNTAFVPTSEMFFGRETQ